MSQGVRGCRRWSRIRGVSDTDESADGTCVVQFDGLVFGQSARAAVYRVRAMEVPSPSVTGGAWRCKRDEPGWFLEVYLRSIGNLSGSSRSAIEERAWSSPISSDSIRSRAAKPSFKRGAIAVKVLSLRCSVEREMGR